jgi:hypothetical protein
MPPIDPALIKALSGARQPTLAGSGQTRINPALTQAMMAQGLRPGPVTSKTQAFAKMGTAAIGGILERLGAEKIQAVRDKVAGALDGLGGISKSQKEFAQALISADKIPEALDMIKGIKDRQARREDERFGRSSRERIAKGKVAKFDIVDVGGVTFQQNRKTREFKALPGQGKTSAMKDLLALGEVNEDGTLTDAGKALLRNKFEAGKTEANVYVDARPPAEMMKKTLGTLENKLIDTQISLARLDDVETLFDRKFQTAGFKTWARFLSFKEKLGFDLDPDERKDLTDFSKFKAVAFDNINRYIKEITGAQMSEAEVKRLKEALPDPGIKGYIFSGDSPTEFEAKMVQAKATLEKATARLFWMRKRGIISDFEASAFPDTGDLRIEAPTLSQMTKIINKDKKKWTRELKDKGFEGENLERMIDKRMKENFGI